VSRVLAKMVQSGYGFFGEDTGTHARNAKRRDRGSHEDTKNAKRVIEVHAKPRRTRRKGRVGRPDERVLRRGRRVGITNNAKFKERENQRHGWCTPCDPPKRLHHGAQSAKE